MKAMLEHYRGHEQYVARILDLMDQSIHQYRCIITPFLTPQEQMIAQKVIGKQCFIRFWGGYEGAEMKRMALSPYEIEEEVSILCLKAYYRKQEKQLTHRDLLGALLHLGLERNQFGDLLVNGNELYVLTREEHCEFIISELRRIGRYSITFERYDGTLEHEPEFDWLAKTISANRLDCIVAACINGSRSKADALIKGKLVKVNHLPLEDSKHLCNNNCTVSIRGYGRFLIRTTDRMSRKGRMVIEIGTYK